MGFDNECILNIQSLPGEYFCPICRTLVYPNESLQTQCTHLYCKPCLAYVVATTHVCPYDGYLVTEAESKPLIESNKSIAEAIDKILVHCLYHRSGCEWQGSLSECTTHCIGCNFGSSPVVCNRCGTQIIHRQVQEHAQICPGIQPQTQQLEDEPSQLSAEQNQVVAQAAVPASQESSSQTSVVPSGASAAASASAPAVASATALGTSSTGPAGVPSASVHDQGHSNVVGQAQAVMSGPTPEQLYQQQQLQYQQYYKQYAGYNPYQQQYQQYSQYQQQAHPQYPHPQHIVQGQQHPQPYLQAQPHLQPQPQPQPQPQGQPQPLPQSQPQPHIQPHSHPQPQMIGQQPQMQAPVNQQQPYSQQPQPQMHPQMHPPPHAQVPGQQLGQPRPHPVYSQPQPIPQSQPPQLQPTPRPQHMQPMVAQQPSQPSPQVQQSQPQLRAYTQPQLQQPRPNMLPQPQPHLHPHALPQPQPQLQHASAQAVTGYQSYPQPQHQQMLPGAAPHQRPMNLHPQQQGVPHQQPQHSVQMQHQLLNQQPPQMHPPPAHAPVQVHQQAGMQPMQGPQANLPPSQQQGHHSIQQPGQQIHRHPGLQPLSQRQSLPQQRTHVQLHSNQLHQPGSFPLPHLMHSQPGLRPQGPQFMQQHSPAPTQLQQTVSSGPAHQAAAGSIPVMPNHAVSQQPFPQSPGCNKLLQSSTSQLSLNHNYMARSSTHPQMSSERQLGYTPQLTHVGSQGTFLLHPPASPKTNIANKQADFMSDKTGLAPQMEVEMIHKNAEATEEIDPVHGQTEVSESDGLKPGNEEKAVDEVEEKNVCLKVDVKGLKYLEKDDDVEAKPTVKEEASGRLENSPHRLGFPTEGKVEQDVKKSPQELKEIESQEGERVDKVVDGPIEGEDSATLQMPRDSAGISQSLGTVSEMLGDAPPQLHPVQRKASPTQDRVLPQPGYQDPNLPQLPNRAPVPSDVRGMPPPVQMQSKVLGPPIHPPNFAPHRPPAPDRMLPQHVPHLGSNQERQFQDPPLHAMQARGQPSIPTQMRPPGPGFPEHLPPQRQPSVVPDPFQPFVVRQPSGSFHPEVPPSGFPGSGLHFSLGRGPANFGPPHKSFESPAMTPQIHGQGQIPPSGGPRISQVEPLAGLPSQGPPSRVFDMPTALMTRGPPIRPEGQIGHPHPQIPTNPEAFLNKMPASFDGRQPEPHQAILSEHVSTGMQVGVQSNMMKMNGFPGKVPDSSYSHGSVGERFKPLPEEKYKSIMEGFRPSAEECFRSYGQDPGRCPADRREFEDDLKQFPRPYNLDGEGGPKFENYSASSRSHGFGLDAVPRSSDRAMQGFGHDGGLKTDAGSGVVPLKVFPHYQSTGHPVSSGTSSLDPMGTVERQRLCGFHDDNMGRRNDISQPDIYSSASDFGRHHMENLPPLRRPGTEFGGFSSSRFRPCLEDFNGRDHMFIERLKPFNLPLDSVAFRESRLQPGPGSGVLPSPFYRGEADGPRLGDLHGSGNLPRQRRSVEMDGPDILPNHIHGGGALAVNHLSNRLRSGEMLGPRNLPSHLFMGEPTGLGGFHSHLLLGEPARPGTVPPHLRIGEPLHFGEPGFRSSFPMHGFPNEPGVLNPGSIEGDLDSFDYSSKRKHESMGWCRICKIDCETVEGLDLHSQKREHQKMAMNIVLSIRKDNAKKQKLSSEDHGKADKSKKASLESRGTGQ